MIQGKSTGIFHYSDRNEKLQRHSGKSRAAPAAMGMFGQ